MKRMLKKLTAMALSGAMVLSLSGAMLLGLSVTALATDIEATEYAGSASGTPTTTASGAASGTIENQGKIPDAVLKVKLPTSAADVFDVYIDPHNLIQESSAALFDEEISAFATDTLVYFKNSADSTITYSKTSDDIKIVNKSSVPVTVKMDAKWTKGTGATYSLADSADDLAKFKTAGAAALYLNMKDSEDNEAPVVEKDKGTPVITTSIVRKTGNTGTASQNALQYLPSLIKSVKFEWTDKADATDKQLINEGTIDSSGDPTKDLVPRNWNLTFGNVTAKKTPTITLDAAKLPKYPTLANANATTVTYTAYKTQAAPSLNINETLNLDNTKTYTVEGGKGETVLKIQKGSDDIALITFVWDYKALAANAYAWSETAKETGETDAIYELKLNAASGEGAQITTDVNRTDGAYSLEEDPNNSGVLAWVLDPSLTEDSSFHSLSFNLTGAITDGDVCAAAWDEAFGTDVTGAKLDVEWKVYPCDGFDPVVTVTNPLTSSTGVAEVKLDFGCGEYKTTAITGASYMVGTAKTTLPLDNVVVDGKTANITSVAGLYSDQGGANGVLTLTFSNASTGYTADVDVDLKTSES